MRKKIIKNEKKEVTVRFLQHYQGQNFLFFLIKCVCVCVYIYMCVCHIYIYIYVYIGANQRTASKIKSDIFSHLLCNICDMTHSCDMTQSYVTRPIHM